MAIKEIHTLAGVQAHLEKEREDAELERQRHNFESRISDLKHQLEIERNELSAERSRYRELSSKILVTASCGTTDSKILSELLEGQRRLLAAMEEEKTVQKSKAIAEHVVNLLSKENEGLRRRCFDDHADRTDDDEERSESLVRVNLSSCNDSHNSRCFIWIAILLIAWIWPILVFYIHHPSYWNMVDYRRTQE